jgi:hypothetical protein
VVSAPVTLESTTPEPQPAEKSVFNFVDKRNAESQAWSTDMKSEEAQAKLDRELAAVEEIPVEEVPETPVGAEAAAETAALEAAFAAPASAEAPEAPEAVAPKRGELSHHDYHVQRPADGSIYRTSKTIQRASGGSEPAGRLKNDDSVVDEYDRQNGVDDPSRAQKHYDEVMGTNEAAPETPERPSYETMDIYQLALASAKAEMVGDKFVTDDIRNVYTTAMEEAYTKPGSTISYEEHEEALARFDRLADAAIEHEKARDPEHHALVDAAVERANKEPSIGDKLKGLWKKGVESTKKLFRPEFWGERFTAATNKLHEASTWALNLGVNETDSDEEADKKRKRNRVLFIAGGAALAVAAVAGASYGIGFAVGSSGEHHAATEALTNGGTGGGHGAAAGDVLSAHDQAVADALTPKHGTDALNNLSPPNAVDSQGTAAHSAAEAFSIHDPGFNVTHGEGGFQLFNKLHIDLSKWDANKATLLNKFPDNFYSMDGGQVGIEDVPLSDAAKEFINTLR